MIKDKNGSVSIILPCSGFHTHPEAPYSKELVRVNKDTSVIDYSFNHILSSRVKLRVVIIVGPNNFDTVQYLYEKYNNKVDLVYIFYKKKYKEATSPIRSAEHLLGDKNILLMPNAIIEYKDKRVTLIDKILNMLDHQPFVFVCKDETSVTRLRLFRALRIEDGKVVDYRNKPLEDIEKYNALGVSYGFKKEIFNEVISVIEKRGSPKNNSPKLFQESVIYNSLPVKVAGYIDISTWTNLNAHLLKQYLIKSGIDSRLLKTNLQ